MSTGKPAGNSIGKFLSQQGHMYGALDIELPESRLVAPIATSTASSICFFSVLYKRYLIAMASCSTLLIIYICVVMYYVKSNDNGDKIFDVYIIRHAEKSHQKSHICDPPMHKHLIHDAIMTSCSQFGLFDMCGGSFLTEEGLKRADCIAEQVSFTGLKQIYAQNPGQCRDKAYVKREYQTVLPLAIKRNISIQSTFYRGQETMVAEYILSLTNRNLLCTGNGTQGSVLLSWNHENIPSLTREFGSRFRFEVNDTDFDTVYKLQMYCKTGKMKAFSTFSEYCQS